MILTQNLKRGDGNGKYSWWQKGIITEVKILQRHMNRLGFNAGPVDGILGPLSEGAIKRMQKYLGTKPDGWVGPKTRALLNNSCSSPNKTKNTENKKETKEQKELDINEIVSNKNLTLQEKIDALKKIVEELIRALKEKMGI